MKANRKFLNRDDDAVSPVIAVILMVAITVVLAATVYVWVSGFGSNSGTTPAKSMSLTSAGAILQPDCDTTTAANQQCKEYTVTAASPGMRYSDITPVLGGNTLTFASSVCATVAPSTWAACAGPTARVGSDVIQAGDKLHFEYTTGGTVTGQVLQILDPSANSVILTLTVS